MLRRRRITWNLGMSLATIFFVSIFCVASPAASQQTAPESAAATKPAETVARQDQGSAPPAQNPPAPSQAPPSAATPAKTSAEQNRPAAAKRPRHNKRVPSNCDSAPATADSRSTPAPVDPTAPGTAPAPGTSNPSSAAANCPPSKVIVRQGGTSEPSIQLAGGTADDQTSHQRDTANQMLGSTEANLKKIAGRQLSPNQQDMVNQIRQFIEQSKTASDDGDLDRARTLAWKAQLLSEELVKPEKQ